MVGSVDIDPLEQGPELLTGHAVAGAMEAAEVASFFLDDRQRRLEAVVRVNSIKLLL